MFGTNTPTIGGIQNERQLNSYMSTRTDGSPGENMSKNHYDRMFQTNGMERHGYNTHGEQFFGAPGKSLDTRLQSGWNTKSTWADEFLGVNLVQTSKIINMIERLMDAFAHVETIAPLIISNDMQFKVTTKTYTDDAAEFIAVEGPVSSVGIAIAERTEQLKYIGKGAFFQMHMMTSQQGREELLEKLMLIATAIKKTEYNDFLLTLRNGTYPEVEARRMVRANGNIDEYLDQEKSDFDCFRKSPLGVETTIEKLSSILSEYGGYINHLLVPEEMYTSWIFQPEHWVFSLKGNKTGGVYDQVDRPVFSSSGTFDKIKGTCQHKLKGLELHMIPRILTTSTDCYMDILSKNTMIGNFFGLHQKRDPGFDCPDDYNQRDYTVKAYSQQHDSYVLFGYSDFVNNSARFKKGGSPRAIPASYKGCSYPEFKKLDPFYCDSRGTIKLFGEMAPSQEHAKNFYKGLNYSAATFLKHLEGRVNIKDMKNFDRMFSLLEKVKHTPNWMNDFMNKNYRISKIDDVDEDLFKTEVKYFLVPDPLDGTYVLPKDVMPFGCASLPGVRSVAKMDLPVDTTIAANKNLAFVINTANEFIVAFDNFYTTITRALPVSCLTSEELCKHFTPRVYSHVQADEIGRINMFNNGFKNATNFIHALCNFTDPTDIMKHIKGNKVAQTGYPYLGAMDGDNGHEECIALNKLVEDLKGGEGGEGGEKEKEKENLITHLQNKLGNSGFIAGEKNTVKSLYGIFTNIAIEGSFDDLSNPSSDFYSGIGIDMEFGGMSYGSFYALKIKCEVLRKTDPKSADNIQGFIEHANARKGQFWIWYNSRLLGESLRASKSEHVQTGLVFSSTLTAQALTDSIGLKETVLGFNGVKIVERAQSVSESYNKEKADDRCMDYTKARNSTEDRILGGHVMNYFDTLNMHLDNDGVSKPKTHWGNTGDKGETYNGMSIAHVAFRHKLDRSIGSPLKALGEARKFGIRNRFHDCALIMTLLADFNSRNMNGMYNERVAPIVEYLAVRPFCRCTTYPIIGVATGALERRRGHMLTMMTLNGTSGVVQIRYTQSCGTIIRDRKNIVLQENVFVLAAQGGCGTTFYDYEAYLKHNSDYFDPDQLRTLQGLR